MEKKKIFISPSNQTGNKYAAGGTTEAVQCGRIGEALKKALERCGFEVKMMHLDTMADKVAAANAWGADYYICIHTNACNGKVGGTRLFFYTMNGDGQKMCEAISTYLFPLSPGTSEGISQRTDLYETRKPKAYTAYVEVDFHDVAEIAKWIIDHVEDIAEVICKGVCDRCGEKYVAPEVQQQPAPAPAVKKLYTVKAGTFSNKQNADAIMKKLAAIGVEAYIQESEAK